uniref:Uncharacterized protein n=1 Tax=Plectus sambesii TaxID=2011161 RepID=A0A914WX79_9BILA
MSQSSQSETKGDDLRTTIQKSLDNHRRLMEEIERLETAIDDVNKATALLEEEVHQSEEKLTLKNIQLQSVYDEIKTTRRSVERLNQSCASSKQQCLLLERQHRQEALTVTADAAKREKAAAQAEQLVERAHAMFDSADWVVDVKRRLEELAEIEAQNAKACDELELAEETRDTFHAFIKEQNELPFEEFVVSVAAMRLENDTIWRQIGQHAAVIKRLEAEDAEAANDDGYHEDVELEQPVVTKAQQQKAAGPVEQPLKDSVKKWKAPEPVEKLPVVCAGVKEVLEQEQQPPLTRSTGEQDVDLSHQSQEPLDPMQSNIVNVEDREATELEESQEMIEPAQSMVVNIGDEEMGESEQLLMLTETGDLADESVNIDADGMRDDSHGPSLLMREPIISTAADLSSSQLLIDPLNESQADLGGSFMAMFGFNNSQESVVKSGAKAAPPFGFGFGGLDASDQQADVGSKKDEGGVPFSLFGF